ncbi:hypothetical protein LP414_15670 [Polaromonas sp. P1(28)-13]|nr:hypothetical protein LP414_15670 [Polaromonas sp. P1(28)-13]
MPSMTGVAMGLAATEVAVAGAVVCAQPLGTRATTGSQASAASSRVTLRFRMACGMARRADMIHEDSLLAGACSTGGLFVLPE